MPQNDRNVYILGAGFSADAGLPLVGNFYTRLRDAHPWLSAQGRPVEMSAIEEVLQLRLDAAATGDRMVIDLDNIEELFSLASAQTGSKNVEAMCRAIASTIDYAGAVHTTPLCEILVDPNTPIPQNWVKANPSMLASGSTKLDYYCPLYEFYLGTMCGFFSNTAPIDNTIITFNYDLLPETGLEGLGIPFDYGIGGLKANFEPTLPAGWGHDSSGVRLLKLHGSLNWAYPGGRGGKMRVFENYAAVRAAQLVPVIVPPTWRKDLDDKPLVKAWELALAALEQATRIYVLGFSMPETDTHFRYLMAAGLQKNISLRNLTFVAKDGAQLDQRARRFLRDTLFTNGTCKVESMTVAQLLFSPGERNKMGRPLADPFMRQQDTVPTWAT